MSTSTNAPDRLQRRMAANQGGLRDLNAFLFDLARPQPDDRVLDLGCGVGNQVISLAPRVRSVTALDNSADLLDRLTERLGGIGNVETIRAGMDEAADLLPGASFTLVLATYSLYYSTDVGRLVSDIARRLLTHDGRFVTVSPDVGNNAEWYADLNRVFTVPADILETSWTSRRRILPAVLDAFSDVRGLRFVNPISYESLDALMSYYDGCGVYCPSDQRDAVARHLAERFDAEGRYTITKRALVIVARDAVDGEGGGMTTNE
jgi:SAM-dependent methyltransferase